MDMEYEHLICSKEEGIATLTLNRPEKLNAFTKSMREGLLECMSEWAEDEEVKAVIVTARGRAFCVGADISYLKEGLSANELPEGWPRIGPPSTCLVKMRQMGKPVIGVINGLAYGGGLGLALACDIRLASEKARFGAFFIKRALAGEWGVTYFLPRILGRERALHFLWTGADVDAEEALEMGMVSQVVPHDLLMGKAMELAGIFTKGPSLAIQQVKKLVDSSFLNGFEGQIQLETYAALLLARTHDYKEGVNSFFEKREARFSGN